jgi:hypothetical protein
MNCPALTDNRQDNCAAGELERNAPLVHVVEEETNCMAFECDDPATLDVIVAEP